MKGRVCNLLRVRPPVIDNRGLLWASGATVPTDDADGYQTGCIFQHTDGGGGTALYVNEGSVTACAFKAVDAGGIDVSLDVGEFASLTHGDGIALSSSDRSAVAIYGDDNNLSIASNVYNLRTRLLLTVDQDGASLRALMAQLKLADGVDVSTGVYTASQGYLELAGNTSAETGATLSCFDASLEIASAKVLTVDSGGVVAGIRVETTGAGTITNNGTCAAILIANPTGAPDWPVGIFIAGPDVLMGIQCGEQDAAVAITSAYPFGVEVQTISSTNIVAGDTGSAAAIYARYEIGVDQTTNTAHIGIFGKLRVKEALFTGNHAGLMGWVEVSGTTIIGGAATTQTSAGSFSVIAEAGLNLTTGFLNGILIDSNITTGATTTGVTAAVRVKVSASCDAWDYGLVLENSSVTTGVSIGTCTTGISIGTCATAAINIASANLNCIKSVFNIGAQLGQYVQGIKMEHTRSGDIQPSTGGWWGAQIVLNAGTGYAALDKTAYVLHCIFKGDATAASSSVVNVARFETQSNGRVGDLLFVSANAGSTVEGDVARFVAHVAPTRAILAVQNGTVGSTPMGICVDVDETMTTGIQFNTVAAVTNLLQITAAANTTYFLLVDAEAGCVPNYSGAGSAIANLKVKIGSTDGYIKIYDSA